jgi:hypothetical protein
MSTLAHFAIATTMLAAMAPAAAQGLSEAKAREIIAPWYSLFNVATRGDVKAIQERVLPPDYESCSGYLPGFRHEVRHQGSPRCRRPSDRAW